MLKIDRTQKHCLRIREFRYGPGLRLLILLSITALYYFSIFTAAPGPAGLPGDWLLLSFPLFLSPYLVSIVRGLRRHHDYCFDAGQRVLTQGGWRLAQFRDISQIQITAANAGCEELRLSLVVGSGTRLDLYEGPACSEVFDLARELAVLLDVKPVCAVNIPGQTHAGDALDPAKLA